jgi:hypothetical protein
MDLKIYFVLSRLAFARAFFLLFKSTYDVVVSE